MLSLTKLLSLRDKKNVGSLQKRSEHGAHSGHRLHQPRGMHGIRSRQSLSNSIESLSDCTIPKERILRRLVVDYRQTRWFRKSDTRVSGARPTDRFIAPRFTANNLTGLSARYTSFLDLGEFLSSNVCNS